jgi:NAD(P)-dependent dehydrogenase (short-subunit alcohol dehydrogenase family)
MGNPQRIQELFGIDGKVAVITGAGRGIGSETARLFAEAGARVAVVDRNEDRAQRVVAEIEAGGGVARAFTVDVSSQASVKVLFAGVRELWGRVDIAVNNAGVYPYEKFLELTSKEVNSIMETNLQGVIFCMQEAIGLMRTRGEGGRIVNMTSNAGWRPVTLDNVIYGASKAGISNITQSTALAFAADGILINAVAPGGVQTEGATDRFSNGPAPQGPILQEGRIPLGRIGKPLDIATAALFLASPASSYITGQVLMVDGGFDVS